MTDQSVIETTKNRGRIMIVKILVQITRCSPIRLYHLPLLHLDQVLCGGGVHSGVGDCRIQRFIDPLVHVDFTLLLLCSIHSFHSALHAHPPTDRQQDLPRCVCAGVTVWFAFIMYFYLILYNHTHILYPHNCRDFF